MTKKIFSLLLIFCIGNNITYMVQAQTLTDYAKQRQREVAGKKQKERNLYERACKEGTLSSYNEYLNIYPKGQYSQDVRKRIANIEKKNEQVFYENICRQENIQGYKEYLEKYPNGSHVQDARDNIAEYQLWNEAKNNATKEAYECYITKSPLKMHLKEAQEQIVILSEDEDWNHCDTKSITDLEKFITLHPQSHYVERARYHLNILKAINSYSNGYKLAAFSYLDEAKRLSPLFDEALSIYKELRDEYLSPKMLLSENPDEIIEYLKDLPTSSSYYDRISNHLAILLSSRLTVSIPTEDIYKALGYARDEATIDIVLRNIRKSTSKRLSNSIELLIKDENSNFTSWIKGNILVGVKLDAEKNVYERSWAFDGGVVIKYGKYTDLFNLLVGANFRFYIFDNYPIKPALKKYAKGTYITGGQIVVPFTARFNIIDLSKSWRMYIGCACNIHNKIHDTFHILKPHSVSFEPQLGFVSRHWEIGAHFRKFARTPYFVNCRSNYIGIHSTYYF